MTDAPGEARAGDRGVADSAATEDRDGVAPLHVAGEHGGTKAGHDATAEQSGYGRRHLGVDRRALTGGHQGALGERADAQRGRQRRAVAQRHLLGGIERREAQPRLAAPARAAVAAHRAPVEDHEVARDDSRDVRPDCLDHARRLMAEEEGEVVADTALAVVEVGVADAAGVHFDDRLAWPRIGHDDRLDRYRLLHRSGDDRPYLLRHLVLLDPRAAASLAGIR